MAVDAHHHFWDPVRAPQPWITEEIAVLARSFGPNDLQPLLSAAGVDQTVLVQSAASDGDTDYMFAVAGDVPWVGAIVAWCSLDDWPRAGARLAELKDRPKFRGVRHIIHFEADPHWILRRQVWPALEALQQAGLVLELPAVYPRHLGDVPELARRHPELRIVIDHLGKPPLGTPEMGDWEALLRQAAEKPNVYAKISGLNTLAPSPDWGSRDLEPAVRVAVSAFVPDRLMLGSDWPVALLNGTYGQVWAETSAAVQQVAGDAAARALSSTAQRLYQLQTEPTRPYPGLAGPVRHSR
jgi:L-fuconolactonase